MDKIKKMRGEVEAWGYKHDGPNKEQIYHDKGDNVVTNWAKHGTMHMLTGEVFSTHGNRTIDSFAAKARRSSLGGDHVLDTVNNDGTLLSGELYLGNNDNYDMYNALPNTTDHPANTDPAIGDSTDGFVYTHFPTKMLFGTGIEYVNWDAVIADGKDGADQGGYGNAGNGGWSETSFNDRLVTTDTGPILTENFYSNIWDGGLFELTKARTVNDVFSAALSDTDNPVDGTSFGVKGAIKDATFNGGNGPTVLTAASPYFAKDSFRGVGQPAFIYCSRSQRFMQDGGVVLEIGDIVGTEDLESKITFTVVLPEQPLGEFYPYNGYTLKTAGLFSDAAMLLKNTVPASNSDNDDATTQQEWSNYHKMPTGVMWATRNIAPFVKSHDTSLVIKWSIYL